jgi:hypothetical protein
MTAKAKEKVKIDVAEVRKARAFLRSVNKHELEDIEWIDKGTPLKISDKAVAEFQYLGLNNSDFIDGGYYKN